MKTSGLAGFAMLVGRTLLAPLILAACGASVVAAQDVLPAEYRGDWVADTLHCDSPIRFRTSATHMWLINGGDVASWGDIGLTYTFFGPDYQGIQAVAMPDFNSGNSPFMVTFNFEEKPGVTWLDIYQEVANPTGDPVVERLQSAARALAKRFPINQVPLRRCPGGARAGPKPGRPGSHEIS